MCFCLNGIVTQMNSKKNSKNDVVLGVSDFFFPPPPIGLDSNNDIIGFYFYP
jgi:hypothetical protein